MIFDPQVQISEEAIFSKDHKNPVYIVLSSGSSLFANAIKTVTKNEFSHAMIAFNSKLDPLYSFGTRPDGKLGFVINNPKDRVWDIEDCKYSVYVMYVTNSAKRAMQKRLNDFISKEKDLRYDFKGILDIWRGKDSESHNKWFCSRFVMEIISKAQSLTKVPSLWRPGDIEQLSNISLVNRGFNFYNYNPKVTERHCKNIEKGTYDPGDVIYEDARDEYVKYLTGGSEYYLEKEYDKRYKPYHYKIPAVGFPTNKRDEYLAVEAAVIKAAKNYYTFKPADANRNYPFKFFEILNIDKAYYIKLINGNVPAMKRFDANLYHVNIRDDNRRISVILVARPGEIFAMYFLLPNGDTLYRFNYEGLMFQEQTVTEAKDTYATVYFTRKITPESLQRIYHAMNHPLLGKVGVKISTGEKGGHNFLSPNLIKNLVQELNGTILECNTAYKGSRDTSEAHWKTIEDHGFLSIADVDLMDEDGDIDIPVRFGYHLKKNYIGNHADRYNTILMLSHFKGHMMAGYGGALKNMSIGMASSRGKNLIHTHGLGGDMMKADRDKFLESMVDADSSIMDYYGRENIIYINVANNLSVDCDCDPDPSKPKIEDIGIFASTDPVAVDQACIDAVWTHKNPKRTSLMRRITSRNGIHTIECAEKKGLGTRKYTIVDIDSEIEESTVQELSSSVEKDFSSKKDMSLSQFTKVRLADAIVQVYGQNYPSLRHIRINNHTKGYIWLNDRQVVGYINVEEKDDDYKWIQAFEIYVPYKGHGLSKQILGVAVRELGATNLSVSKNNEIAIRLYKSYGFKTYKSTDSMYFMSRDKNIDEAYYVRDPLTGKDVKTAFTDNDYRLTAELAQKQIRNMHNNGKLTCVTCRNIELKDGNIIYADYVIEKDIDAVNIQNFINLMNKIVETTTYCGVFEIPKALSKDSIGQLTLLIDMKWIEESKEVEEKGIKSYKNPARQLKVKNTIKKHDQIAKGNYSDIAPTLPEPKKKRS